MGGDGNVLQENVLSQEILWGHLLDPLVTALKHHYPHIMDGAQGNSERPIPGLKQKSPASQVSDLPSASCCRVHYHVPRPPLTGAQGHSGGNGAIGSCAL